MKKFVMHYRGNRMKYKIKSLLFRFCNSGKIYKRTK